MIFTTRKRIRFQHCDPAGIVFYPRYYGLLHEVQEDFFNHLGFGEHQMIAKGYGIPIVHMETTFTGMSRFGDEVAVDLSLFKLGSSSLGMQYVLYNSSQPADIRLKARGTVVYSTVPEGRPMPFPSEIRAALTPYLTQDAS